MSVDDKLKLIFSMYIHIQQLKSEFFWLLLLSFSCENAKMEIFFFFVKKGIPQRITK